MPSRTTLVAVAALTLFGQRARAYELEVDLATVGQGYQVASGAGTLLSRRRLDQYLGLHVWNLGPTDGSGRPTADNQVYFSMSLRTSTDLADDCLTDAAGRRACERWPVADPSFYGGRDTRQELATNTFEVLYAYLGVRDLGGFLDVKLGRQLQMELYELRSFDGLSLEARTRWHVAALLWAGLLVDGALPFDSPIFRADGVAPSNLSTHDQDWKPTVGALVRSLGWRDLDVRLGWTRTFSPAQHTTVDERAIRAADGTTEEKVALSLRARLAGGALVPWAGARYDLVVGALDVIQAGARLRLDAEGRHALQLEYVYSLPTFDGDSIWNVFARREFDDVRLGYDLRLGRLSAYARGLARQFHDVSETADRIDPSLPAVPAGSAPSVGDLWSRLDWGGNVGARLDLPSGWVRVDGYAELGYGGTHAGVDAAARLALYRDVLFAEGRLTLARFVDDARPLDHADSVGAQLGARVALAPGIVVHLVLEDNVSRLYASQLRLYALVDLSFLLGSRGFATVPPVGVGLGQMGTPARQGTGWY